jgi:hypothetical protein
VTLLVAATVAPATAAVAGSRSFAPLPIRVTRDSVRMPAGCRPRAAARLLDRVFVAFNKRNRSQLNALVAPSSRRRLAPHERPFDRFYMNVPPTFGTFSRQLLLASLVTPFAQHERLQLLEIAVSREQPAVAGFGFLARRAGDDLRKVEVISGKGGIDCTSQRLYNLFAETRTTTPRPARRPAIACSARVGSSKLCPPIR